MNTSAGRFAFVLAFVITIANGQQKSCKPCDQLKDLQLPDVKITSADYKLSDSVRIEYSGPIFISKPFCRVMGTISKEINFELLLPEQWNGRFLMSGGGGFVGTIQNGFRDQIANGYATAGTDTGHKGNGLTAEWAHNNMERQINFGRLAIHRTAVVSKSIIQNFYCSAASYSYFLGCSRGGGQAMVEAQYYPEDFDGIVAGAPAFSWPAIGGKFIEIVQKNYPDPANLKPVFTSDNLTLLHELVLKQCDSLDGAVDKIIGDPRQCKIDLAKLPLCADGKPGSRCFTKEQVAVIKKVYEPLIINQKQVYPGFPVGGEAEQGSWDWWIVGTNPTMQIPSLQYMLGTNMYKYLVFGNPDWDYTKYDFKNFEKETAFASSFLDATQTDYSEFKKRKGKLIFYHGWNDVALSAYATIDHYEAVLQKDKEADSYMRLFLLPGVLHCGGGPGCDNVDWVRLIRDWVENSKAPDQVVANKLSGGKVVSTRTLYPYAKGR
jgi:hypothetical protein